MHLETEKAEREKNERQNRRNGHSRKTVKGEFGKAEIAASGACNSDFEPQMVKKGQTRFTSFDDKISI